MRKSTPPCTTNRSFAPSNSRRSSPPEIETRAELRAVAAAQVALAARPLAIPRVPLPRRARERLAHPLLVLARRAHRPLAGIAGPLQRALARPVAVPRARRPLPVQPLRLAAVALGLRALGALLLDAEALARGLRARGRRRHGAGEGDEQGGAHG